MQFKSLFVFASLPVLLFAQTTPAEIENAITNDLVPALDADLAAIDAFSVNHGTLDEATAIHDANVNLNNILLTVTSDIQTTSCPLSDSDASAILTLFVNQSSTIQQALEDITRRVRRFKAVGAASTIQQDLETLQASSDANGATLLSCVSSNVAPDVEAFTSAVDAVFAPALAAFNKKR